MNSGANRSAIYLSVQSPGETVFWISRIIDGINAYAGTRRLHIERISASEALPGQTVILVGTHEESLIRETLAVEARGACALIINATIPGALAGRCSASFSIEAAVRECVNYLAAIGCTYPALVGVNTDSATDLVKRSVFVESTSRVELAGERAKLCECSAQKRLSDAVDEFIEDFSPERCDGVICANDTAAILLIGRLKRLGIDVGREFPVIGMGNSHIGKRMTPSLTSVDFDYFELGSAAARLHMYMTRYKELYGASMSVSLPAKLIVRESTGNAVIPHIEPGPTEICKPNLTFTGTECERIITLENYLQGCDSIDRELIFSASESYRTLSERLFVSERTLKYRMSNIMKRLGVTNKSQLCEYVGLLHCADRLQK